MTLATTWIAALLLSGALADVYHVTAEGADDPGRDGKSRETAWKTLAFACERVPEGGHTIRLGPGTFVCARTARPKGGVTIEGASREATRLLASKDWPLGDDPSKRNPSEEYLISLERAEGVTIRGLALTCEPAHRITGAVRVAGSKKIVFRDLHVRDFRWAGLHLEHSSEVEVDACLLEDASTEKFGHHGGLIRTRWLKNCRIHHSRILSSTGGGYGYKGGGHERVRIDHNLIDVRGEFSIESAHENEYGLEIDRNHLTRCISVPKGGQGDDPNKRGTPYSVWIHENLLTDSYTVEGPRNHLLFERNYVKIAKTGGRLYTHHGGTNHGPIWIRHNVVENVDRAFVWMNQGLAEKIEIVNNTVLCAEAGKRAGTLIDSYSGERLNGWIVKNNVFIAPASEPRKLIPTQRGVPEKISVSRNLCINVTDAPEENFTGTEPGFRKTGDAPWPFFAPAAMDSFVVDRGVEVGLRFKGKAPDLGAYEWGEQRPLPEIPR